MILGARWTLSVEGTRYRGEAGNEVRLEWIGDSETQPRGPDNAAIVEAGLNATVDKILATGRSVVLLGPVPEIGRNVPTAAARQVLLGWTPTPRLTRQSYEARAGRTEQIMMRIADADEAVQHVPLADLFCDEHRCRTTSAEGHPLYRDDNHISLTASISLLPARLRDIWQ